MKKTDSILHPALNRVLAEMGHNDEILISDAGFPCPLNVECIYLGVVSNLPRLLPVLTAVVNTLTVQEAVIASELEASNPTLLREMREVLPAAVPLSSISNVALKDRSHRVRAVIRTGECSWYGNILLVAGVSF